MQIDRPEYVLPLGRYRPCEKPRVELLDQNLILVATCSTIIFSVRKNKGTDHADPLERLQNCDSSADNTRYLSADFEDDSVTLLDD